MKKFISTFLIASLLVLFSSVVAFAEVSPETYEQSPEYFTQENLEKIKEHNEKVEGYITSKNMLRAGSSKKLSVPVYTQQTNYTCGPACARMVLKYLGYTYSESELATASDTTDDSGAIVWKLRQAINDRISSGDGYIEKYIGSSGFSDNLIYSIDNDRPVICHTMAYELDYYNNNTAFHGHYIVANGYRYGMSGSTSDSTAYIIDPNYDSRYNGEFTCDWGNVNEAIAANAGYIIMSE